ncbi:hypothetical protein OHT57_01045 [Streptomyces sp. NBC_00285]|uniref:hypothetical protein n=1 Tax=Streptomyces sp. NBC_00285 TaxID=2975700 RepID=UPI002E2DF1BE|nr:hypothetical protein [Streptomyces sp. NBC_00285]
MSDGSQSREPVREVVQRTETVVRTVVLQDSDRIPMAPRAAQRLNGQPYTLPEDAVEWIEALAVLRRAVTDPKVYPFREHVALACEKAAQALRGDVPEPVMPEPGER